MYTEEALEEVALGYFLKDACDGQVTSYFKKAVIWDALPSRSEGRANLYKMLYTRLEGMSGKE